MPNETRLTTSQRNELTEHAQLKFLANSVEKLTHGVRLRGRTGDPATVYWSDLHPGNDVEVAVSPQGLSGKYDTAFILGWLSLVRVEVPVPTNRHHGTLSWPTFGFSFENALVFMNECALIRRGLLRVDRIKAIQAHTSRRSQIDREEQALEAQYEHLRPTQPQALIDLVHRVGISVRGWYYTEDGRPVAKPRSNPAYRFRWSFGGGSEPALASLWHASIKRAGGHLEYVANFRQAASDLEEVQADRTNPTDVVQRAAQQAPRARKLDNLVLGVGVGGTLRIVFNEGDMRDEAQLGEESSHVRVRRLDDLPWVVHSYDNETGACVLRRLQEKPKNRPPEPHKPRFIDQHDLPGSDNPERRTGTASAYARDALVRARVLERAQGQCELCDTEGFLTADGSKYLETHHVVPLSEKGVDREWNVVGLCPGHHREAHHGQRRDDLRQEMMAFLRGVFGDDVVFVMQGDGAAATASVD